MEPCCSLEGGEGRKENGDVPGISDSSTQSTNNAINKNTPNALALPLETVVPDAKPSADPSEVDANPISWPQTGAGREVISVPSARDSNTYDLTGVKKVIIFNQKTFAPRLKLNPRNGTEVDVRAIQVTFKSLSWEVSTYNDSTVAQIRAIILNQVQLCESEVSALAIFILSHGEDNGTIFASDYPFRVDHDVLAQLTADKCPSLVGRPKLVFVQACQGQETDQGVSVTDRRRRHTSQDSTATYKIPNYADFLIFQASFWDHFSFRSSETGSWFIQALCDKIDKSHEEEPLMDILLSVSATVALNKESNVPGRPNLDKKKQVPLLYSTMLRKMYLKGEAPSTTSNGDVTPKHSPAVIDAFGDLRMEESRNRSRRSPSGSVSGSVRSSARRGSKDKDCQIM